MAPGRLRTRGLLAAILGILAVHIWVPERRVSLRSGSMDILDLPVAVPRWSLSHYNFSDSVIRGLYELSCDVLDTILRATGWVKGEVGKRIVLFRVGLQRQTRKIHAFTSGRRSQERAWATCVSDWKEVAGAVSVCQTLKGVKSQYPLIVLVDREAVEFSQLDPLLPLNCIIVPVDPINLNITSRSQQKIPKFTHSWTKLQAFSLQEFQRVAYVSPHTIFLRNMDDIFDAWPGVPGFPPRSSGLLSGVPSGDLQGVSEVSRRLHEANARARVMGRARCLCMKANSEGKLTNGLHCPLKPHSAGINQPSRELEDSIWVFSPDITIYQAMESTLRNGVNHTSGGVLDFLSAWFESTWTEMNERDCRTTTEALCHPDVFDRRLRTTRALSFIGYPPWSTTVKSLREALNQSSSLRRRRRMWEKEENLFLSDAPEKLTKAQQMLRAVPTTARLYLLWWRMFKLRGGG
ncbi:hypothetical protein AAMO2058_000244100 [Amorphochlora amoebiformis]